ncbi:family 16 glycoside hydrolase [Tundrisphaera sp. TA3]|uniref:family 16 glycoside hydrolase n=1 Tax=Tundrisphaera sp. TA3 TaxID=3435775 RepID=UPI003EBECA98
MAVPPLATHPTDETLHAYGLGKLDDAGARAVDEHLEGCLACRARVADAAPDSFLGRLREARPGLGSASMAGGTLSFTPQGLPAGTPAADTIPPGLAAHPDYRITKELGRGGMGVVYLAHNTMMGRDEVLKVIGHHILERPGILDRFLREIRAVARLRHPNVVAAYATVRFDGGLALALEYVEGLDLAKLVRTKGPLAVAHAAYFAHQAALGLQEAHKHGLVHRDIKPHNLMLTHDGKARVVKVLDFGLAKATREDKLDAGLTSQGQALGTPDYIAPEQILNAPDVDIRADIYSLGGTLYYLLAGRPPFQANSLYDIYQAHMSRDADPLNLVRPEVPAELAALVAKMMAKDPNRRFQTPDEVARALAPFFKPGKAIPRPAAPPAAEPTRAARPTPPEPPTQPRPLPRLPSQAAPPPLAAGAPGAEWQSLIDFGPSEAPPAIRPDPPAPSSAGGRPPWIKIAAAGVLLLIAGIMAAAASGVFKARTPNGTIVVEGVPADADVLVEGSTLAIARAGDTATISEVPAGRGHRIKVVVGGAEVWAEEATVKVGGQAVRLSYRPRPSPAGAAPLSPRGSFVAEVGDGDWSLEGDELVQSRMEPPAGLGPNYAICFGDRGWSDYDLTLEAKSTGGPDGFGVGIHSASDHNGIGINYGAYGNRGFDVFHNINGNWSRIRDNHRSKSISRGEWHRVRIEVRSARIRTFYDDELMFDVDDLPLRNGRLSLFMWKSAARFRNIRVISPDGKVMLEGLPRIMYPPWLSIAGVSAGDGPSVFNGKDIADWSAWGDDGPMNGAGTEAVWSVKGGVLHGSGLRSHLFSPRGDYRDFRVRAEVRINDGGNSGLFFRASRKAGFPDGYEARIGSNGTDPNRAGSPDRNPLPPYQITPGTVHPDTWFVLEAEAVGNHIRIWVDGKLQVDWTDPASTYTSGFFAIRCHDASSHVQVRKLAVAEINSTAQDAASSRGFTPLFNGKDLAGWKTHPGQPGGWRVIDGILTGRGAATSHLYTERSDFKDVHVRARVRINDGGAGGLYVRSSFGARNPANAPRFCDGYVAGINATAGPNPNRTGSLYGPSGPSGPLVKCIPESPAPAGRWMTLEMIAEGRKVVVKVDGATLVDHTLRPSETAATGHIALLLSRPQAVIEFASIEIKELNAAETTASAAYPPGAASFQGHHYKAFPQQISWHAAQDRCRSMGGHLAIIESEEENRFVADLARNRQLDAAWLGATDEKAEGRWTWVDGSPMTYANWESSALQPNNKGGIEHYAALLCRFDGSWCDQPDDGLPEQPGYICEWD